MSIVKNVFFSALLGLIALDVGAQDKGYAKKCIEKLSSNRLHGRGYVKNGADKAAKFIASEFEKIGLEPIGNDYFQHFEFPVNSFPSKMTVQVDKRRLLPGVDFLIHPGSPGIRGEFPIYLMQEFSELDQLLNALDEQASPFVLFVDWNALDQLPKQTKSILENALFRIHKFGYGKMVAIAEITSEKLTWSGSTKLFELPKFTVNCEGFSPSSGSTIKLNVKHKFYKNYSSKNVVGRLKGENADSTIVLTAHYDHLGRMGKRCIFPGANDNASGVSLMLNLAKELQKEDKKYDIVVIAFAAEEIGLLGSRYFVEHPLIDLSQIKFLVNLDLAGTGDEGIRIVNGSIYSKQFDRLASLNENGNWLSTIKTRGAACNSDHCYFHERNVPSFFIYTLGGIKAYHDVYDKYETLPLTAYDGYFKLLKSFILDL